MKKKNNWEGGNRYQYYDISGRRKGNSKRGGQGLGFPGIDLKRRGYPLKEEKRAKL